MKSRTIFGMTDRAVTGARRYRSLRGQRMRLGFALLLTASAYAQYGGGTTGGTATPGTPGYGHGKAIGIGVGAPAVGERAIYFMTHRASKVTGWVEAANDGLHLTDDKTKKTL